MIHFGVAGVFGAPRKLNEPPLAGRPREGDVWENSAGARHLVLSVRQGLARLENVKSGRRQSRPANALYSRGGKQWRRVTADRADGGSRGAGLEVW